MYVITYRATIRALVAVGAVTLRAAQNAYAVSVEAVQ